MSRTITQSGKQWLVCWSKGDPSFSDLLSAVKSLPSRRYDPNCFGWFCSPSSELLALCDQYQFTGREALRAASEAKSAPIELTGDQKRRLVEIESKLLPWQPAAVNQLALALSAGSALDASETGTGKTYTSLATCAVFDRPAYVVCPKAVIPQWQAAAAHFGVELAGICNYELLRRGEQSAVTTRKETYNYAGVEKTRNVAEWKLPAETVIIFDECHRMADPKTQNNALGMAALRQGYTVLGMSATAADNPLQMKFSGLLTGLFEDERGWWTWAAANGVVKGKFGYKFDGRLSHLAKIHSRIFPSRGNRVRIADLGDAFPETQIAAECYDLNGDGKKIQKVYDEMSAELDRLARKTARDADDENPLTVRLRARQKVETLKVPGIAEMAQDATDSGMSVAIFVNFNETADALCEKLKTKCVIRGGQSAEERAQCIADFQADREPVIVCNIKAGGVGVSLHGSQTARMRLSIIFPTDSGTDLKQALGRVWRAQGAKSIQRIVFAAGTIEEQVCDNVRRKIKRIDMLNDGELDEALSF